MGIDQLDFQSVQLGYLKILQMGNADPNNTKAGKRIRGQVSCINRGNHRSVIIRPVSHHNSVVFRHNQSVGHHSDDSVVPFRHDTSVCRSQKWLYLRSSTRTLNSQILPQQILLRHGNFSLLKIATTLVTSNTAGTSLELKSVKEMSYLSSQLYLSSSIPMVRTHIWFYLAKQLLTARTKLKTARNTYPEAHMHRRTLYSTVAKTHQLTASLCSLSNIGPGFLTGINRKSYSRRAQRHQSRSKQRRKSTEIYRRRVRMNSNYRGFTGENDEEYRVTDQFCSDLIVAAVCGNYSSEAGVDVRASGNTALSSPCWSVSPHALSGFPGYSAGHGFDPAGGAPGGR
ncbi:hypothetical protein F511_11976 [Dorcoceras hygrometricum]|uniref:Uncharacterized protein n=1 Tax=Dorcoceras hygrometricum TaxID=472368 RepID=A0A2Z7BXX4_9LAMI|nr:hypothetical protein F511_11976 [Dorcoceras hygrometricum]